MRWRSRSLARSAHLPPPPPETDEERAQRLAEVAELRAAGWHEVFAGWWRPLAQRMGAGRTRPEALRIVRRAAFLRASHAQLSRGAA